VKSEKNVTNFVDPAILKETMMRNQKQQQNENKNNAENMTHIDNNNNFNNKHNAMGGNNVNLSQTGNNLGNQSGNQNIINLQQANYGEDQVILNNRKHSQTNLINVTTNNNDPSYRLKLYKSQNKFNLTPTNSENFGRSEQSKPGAMNTLPTSSINYQNIYNNNHKMDNSLNNTPVDKSKLISREFSKNQPMENLNLSSFNSDVLDNHNVISIAIKLKEGVSKVIEIKKNDNINLVVKNFCESCNLGELLIRPITNKILQAYEHVENLRKWTVPSNFESLLKEAYDFYNQNEKWEQIYGEDIFNTISSYVEPSQEKKRNKSV